MQRDGVKSCHDVWKHAGMSCCGWVWSVEWDLLRAAVWVNTSQHVCDGVFTETDHASVVGESAEIFQKTPYFCLIV